MSERRLGERLFPLVGTTCGSRMAPARIETHIPSSPRPLREGPGGVSLSAALSLSKGEGGFLVRCAAHPAGLETTISLERL